MKNEERAKLKAQNQKEVDNLKEAARLTSLLEQALRDKSEKATHIAQPEPMFVNPFKPQSLGQMGCHLIFNKYTGTQCPITHLKTYCNKMAEVVDDEKMLSHFFQNSLSGAALTWYMRLDNTKVKKMEGFS
jgi:hypothetical protein